MKKRNTLYHISLLLLLFSYGCKTSKIIQQDVLKPIPESFTGNVKDSTSAANTNWRQFFTDKTLLQLIDTAIVNNQDMLMAIKRIEAVKSDVIVAKGAFAPKVDLNINVGVRRFGMYTMDAAGNATTEITPGRIVPTNLPDFYVGIQTSWEIDLWGKIRNRKNAAVARFLASVESKNLVLTTLISDVATSYYELLALDNELSILEETILLQQNALEAVRAQKDANRANELGVKQFEAQLLNSKGLKVEVLQQIIETESHINLLLGRFPQPINRGDSLMAVILPAQVQTGVPTALLQNRPDIRQAELELAATKYDVKAAKAAFFPSLNIGGSIGMQAFQLGLMFTSWQSLAFNVLGGLIAPIFNQNALRADFRRTKALQAESFQNYQKTIINGYTEVYNGIAAIDNLQQAYDLKNSERDALNQSIDISNDLFRSNRATYLEVLITQQNALQAKLELVSMRKRQLNATITIYKAVGGGWKF